MPEEGGNVLGQLRAECLCKYIQCPACSRRLCGSRNRVLYIKMLVFGQGVGHESLDTCSHMEYNCKDTYSTPSGRQDGFRLTSACASPARLAGPRRHPPSTAGCDGPVVSRQHVLRSERSGPDQVRDAAQRREGGTRRGGCGIGF